MGILALSFDVRKRYLETGMKSGDGNKNKIGRKMRRGWDYYFVDGYKKKELEKTKSNCSVMLVWKRTSTKLPGN